MKWFTQWRLGRAREKYAAAKAEKEAMELLQKDQGFGYFYSPFNRDRYRKVSGKVAKYEERVESLMRQ
jgi:hypothetical protein